MIEKVINYSLKNRRPIDIIYMKGMEITRRRIKVYKIEKDLIKAIDIDKGVIRSFKKEFILSAANTSHFNHSYVKTEISKHKIINNLQ
ncbi:hypothetical protein [Proteiniborus sp.]|uniref:hypothetical protein n=1 Tax=Proteiniborus sp. TaxID=2079015 RepID=UPI0033338528